MMALRLVMEYIQYKRFMASKTILCQAVLTANGGPKEAHFMRYAAFIFICSLQTYHTALALLYMASFYLRFFWLLLTKQLYHIWLWTKKKKTRKKKYP